jgi:hypothetical protein
VFSERDNYFRKGKYRMIGELYMEVMIPINDTPDLLKELDKGINDMENGRVTAHEDTMKILMQRYEDHVSQNS